MLIDRTTPARATLAPTVDAATVPAPSSRPAWRVALPSLPLLLPVLILGAVLALPALLNRYPLLYSDSGEYLLSAVTKRPPRVRAGGYGLWIFATGGTLTAWGPIIAQSLLLAGLVVRTLRAVGVAMSTRGALLVGGAMLLTGAPWMASELMADVFAGAVLLALYLVVVHWARLGVATRTLCGATMILGCATHTTLSLIAGTVLVAVALVSRSRRVGTLSRVALGRAAALIALSVVGLATFNWARTDHLTIARKGGVFVIGHLVETGLAERALNARCGREPLALCPFRAGLTRPIDNFIWDDASPFYQAYESEAQVRDDALRLTLAVAREEPLRLLGSMLSYTARQFVNVQVFDAARTQPANRFTASVVAFVLPHEEKAMLAARQQGAGVSVPRLLDAILLAALLVSLLLAMATLRGAWRSGHIAFESAPGLELFVLITLLINAFVCANLSGVFGRYQERFAWLLPVIVVASLAGRYDGTTRRSTRTIAA